MVVAAFTVGMIPTPPDIPQTLLSIPLYLLFELGLIMGGFIPNRQTPRFKYSQQRCLILYFTHPGETWRDNPPPFRETNPGLALTADAGSFSRVKVVAVARSSQSS